MSSRHVLVSRVTRIVLVIWVLVGKCLFLDNIFLIKLNVSGYDCAIEVEYGIEVKLSIVLLLKLMKPGAASRRIAESSTHSIPLLLAHL